jgi:dipeptidyl aminopeptidase/acylaminoacyl peptidase
VPDGKRIYFKSDRSGTDQIWWIPAGGGSATQLTHDGAFEAFASPDGKLVYFTKRALGPIWSVPADGGPEEPVSELERFDRISRSWGVAGQGIYFISKDESPHQIVRFFSFATRRVFPLLALEGELIWNSPNGALSSDGRRLLIARLDQETNDLMRSRTSTRRLDVWAVASSESGFFGKHCKATDPSPGRLRPPLGGLMAF